MPPREARPRLYTYRELHGLLGEAGFGVIEWHSWPGDTPLQIVLGSGTQPVPIVVATR